MPERKMIEETGGMAIAREAAERVAHDPYIRHVVQLINSGEFTEPLAAASLREELTECMADLMGGEATFDAHWA